MQANWKSRSEKSKAQRIKEEQQRRIIGSVKDNVAKIQDIGDYKSIEFSEFERNLNQLNQTFQDITTTTVARDDAEAFGVLSNTFSKSVDKRVFENSKISIGSFLGTVKNAFKKNQDSISNGETDWASIGRENCHLFNGLCGNSFMFGTLGIEPRKRKQRDVQASRNKKQITVEERPEEVEGTKDDRGNSQKREREHHEKMQNQLGKLVREKPHGMLEMLLNPLSFTQSVENIFEYSFLVKDFSIIELNEQGVPMVRYEPRLVDSSECDVRSSSLASSSIRSPPFTENQSVLSFDMNDWNEAQKYICPDDFVIKHRVDPIYQQSNHSSQ